MPEAASFLRSAIPFHAPTFPKVRIRATRLRSSNFLVPHGEKRPSHSHTYCCHVMGVAGHRATEKVKVSLTRRRYRWLGYL